MLGVDRSSTACILGMRHLVSIEPGLRRVAGALNLTAEVPLVGSEGRRVGGAVLVHQVDLLIDVNAWGR